MLDLETFRGNLPLGEGPEHERVVSVRTVADPDFQTEVPTFPEEATASQMATNATAVKTPRVAALNVP